MTKLLVILGAICSFFLYPRQVLAQARVKSPDYEVQFPNLNSGAGLPSSNDYILDSTLGAIAGSFSSSGFRVKAGFQYVHSIIPFSFSISDISVDFNTLTPELPVTRQATLTVKAGGAGGYSVVAYENHPLELTPGTTIPDTPCNSGPCSESQAELWTLDTKYGFGFNMDGDDVPTDFDTTSYFRQFADASTSETPYAVMTKDEVTYDSPNNAWPWESVATITYKVNVSGTQPAGTYRNILTFVAIPSF